MFSIYGTGNMQTNTDNFQNLKNISTISDSIVASKNNNLNFTTSTDTMSMIFIVMAICTIAIAIMALTLGVWKSIGTFDERVESAKEALKTSQENYGNKKVLQVNSVEQNINQFIENSWSEKSIFVALFFFLAAIILFSVKIFYFLYSSKYITDTENSLNNFLNDMSNQTTNLENTTRTLINNDRVLTNKISNILQNQSSIKALSLGNFVNNEIQRS